MRGAYKGFGMLIILLAIVVAVFSIPTLIVMMSDQNLDFWVSHFAEKAIDVPIFISIILLFLGPITVIANVIAYIAQYFV